MFFSAIVVAVTGERWISMKLPYTLTSYPTIDKLILFFEDLGILFFLI